jgi:hypothetical protein
MQFPLRHFSARPCLDEVLLHQAVRWIAEHVAVGHATAGITGPVSDHADAVAEEGCRHADHVPLAVTYDRDGHVRLLFPDRLDQLCEPQRGQHVIRTRRAGVHHAVVGRVQMLRMEPKEELVIQAAAPQIRQRRAAIGEWASAPVILLVQKNAVAIGLQLLGARFIAPTELNHG